MLVIKRIVLLNFALLSILPQRCVSCDCGCGDDSVIQYTNSFPEQPQVSPFRSTYDEDDYANPFGPGAFVVRPKPLPKPVPMPTATPPRRSNVCQTAPICNPVYQKAPQLQYPQYPQQMQQMQQMQQYQMRCQMQKRQQLQQQQRLLSNPIIEPLESVRFDDDFDTCPSSSSYDSSKRRLRQKLNRFNCARSRRYF